MAVSRRKAPRQHAPQTIEDAVALIGRYRTLIDQADRIKADAASSIAAIEAARDGFAAPVEQEIKAIFGQLRAWWAVAAPELTDGKRKSVELSGCLIGERTTPPSLKLPKGMKEDDAVAAIQSLRWSSKDTMLRVKTVLDKPSIIKALGIVGVAEALLSRLGFSTVQKEEFFIDRAGKKDADPELVDTGAKSPDGEVAHV